MQQVSETAKQHNGPLRVLIAGGGTGGHVIPALAVAKELRGNYGAEVELLGTSRGIEMRLVPEAGFPLHLVEVGQLANVSLLTRARTSLGLPIAIRQCLGLLRQLRPHVVIGVGGYASGPAMLAAIALRLPTLVYEPNAYPGMVNRTLGRLVSAAAVAFEETLPFFRKAVLTGVPVREEIVSAGPIQLDPPRLLVTAGSNGARIFNETLPLIASALLQRVAGLTIVHQIGERAFDSVKKAYSNQEATWLRQGTKVVGPDRVHLTPFLSDMPAQLNRATLVLARSGSTVAELAAAGRPSLLVPFPRAADDHQTKNAQAMVRGGAAELLSESELTSALLLDRLTSLLQSREALLQMSLNARSMSKPGALREIAMMAVELAQR